MRLTVLLLFVLAASPNTAQCQKHVALIDAEQPRGGWEFGNGPEFPGARGNLELAAERFRDQPVLALRGDFTKGGNYVQAAIALPDVPVERLSFWLNAPAGSTSIPIRLIDTTGQCHQLKPKLNDKGGWQQIALPVDEFFRKMGTAAALDVASQYEKWSGANDGQWRGAVQLVELMLNTRSNKANKPDLYISDIRADVVIEATAAAASFTDGFESAESFGDGWRIGGDVRLASPGSNSTSKALLLKRTLDTIQTDTTATSAPFVVTPGMWQVQCSWKSDLHSPDNSYHGGVALEILDRERKPIETIPIDIGFGKQDWQAVSKSVLLPQIASAARFRIELNKTYGSFHVDELSASRLKVQPIEQPRSDSSGGLARDDQKVCLLLRRRRRDRKLVYDSIPRPKRDCPWPVRRLALHV